MCLTSKGNFNYAKLFYSECKNDDLNQVFIFERLKSNHFFSSGRLFSSNRHLCLEMNEDIMMYSACEDTVKILNSGALKHVETGECLGVDESQPKKVSIVDCDSKDVENWTADIFTPPLCDIANFNGYSLLGSDYKHCYRLHLGGIGASYFELDTGNNDCAAPFVKQFHIGVLSTISDEGMGFYTGGDNCGNFDRNGTLRIFESSNVQGIDFAVEESQKCQYDATVMVANCETATGTWTSLETLNLCVDLDDWTKSANGMKVRLIECNPAAWSQHWKYDSFDRLVNRYNDKCLDAGKIGNAGDEILVMECNQEMHQRWSSSDGRYLNQAYSKYVSRQ